MYSQSNNISKKYFCPRCSKFIDNKSTSYVFYNKVCPNDKCCACGLPTIKKAYKYDETCGVCGINDRQNSVRPIKSHFCGDDSMSPFDPSPRNVPGYDPMAFHFFPINENLGLRKYNGKICGGRFYPHLD